MAEKKLSKTELKIKTRCLREVRLVLNSVGIDYFLGGNALLGIMRTGDIMNWPYGIAVALKHEEYVRMYLDIKKMLEARGFAVSLNRNVTGLKEKIKVWKFGHLFELVPWYPNPGSGYRIRAKFQLPEKFFTPGHFETLRKREFQTFNPPEEYLIFRFGKNWRVPIRSTKRKDYENPRYWRTGG